MLVDTQLMAAPRNPASDHAGRDQRLQEEPQFGEGRGTGAAGSDANLAAMITSAVKIRLNYIPFKSGGEVNAADSGRACRCGARQPQETRRLCRGRKTRAPRSFYGHACSGLKDVPTMKEVGYNVVSHSARGILAPAGISKNEEQFLVELMRKVTQSKGWAEYARRT